MKSFFPFLICFCFSFSVFAQEDPKLGSWTILTVQKVANAKGWGGFMELQSRQNQVLNKFFYYELKGGVHYELGRNVTATVAGGRYHTYNLNDLSDLQVGEWRIWEQLVLNQFLDRIKFEHRYRIEQRWLNGDYRNRFRYRLNMLIPLNTRQFKPGTWFISAYDEIFLNNQTPHFERNRFYVGAGYQINNNWTVQAGAIRQYNYLGTGAWNAKNNIVLSAFFKIPGSVDRIVIPSNAD